MARRYWGLTPVPVPADHRGLQVGTLLRSGLLTALLTPAH
jgi:hypothetical protein